MTMKMSKTEIIEKVKEFFKIEELVCDHTLKRFGREASWKFLSAQGLENLYVLRTEILKVPLIINHGNAHQRGLRCNLCPLVKSKKNIYLSGHVLGNAYDITSKELTAAQMRQLIVENQDKLPYPVRMEADVTWLHIDLNTYTDKKVTFFNP